MFCKGGEEKIMQPSSRGDQKRADLLDAALRLFGEKGFKAVSTREIAAMAQATLPSIQHHFGSKEGLYEAVIQHYAEQLFADMKPMAVQIEKLLSQPNVTREQLVDALEAIFVRQSGRLLRTKREWANLFLPAQQAGSEVIKHHSAVLEEVVLIPIRNLIARLHEKPESDPAVKLEALLLFGRVHVFRLMRTTSINFLGWQELSDDKIEEVIEMLRRELRKTYL